MSRLRTANLLGALAGEVVERQRNRMMRHPNATESSAAALNVLSWREDTSNAELARALGLSHTATVRLVDKLEAGGLVESRTASGDRRAVALRLTAAGEAAVRQMLTQRCAALADVTAALTAAEQDQLAGLLETMLGALTDDADSAAHICRLCDGEACPGETCPVHQAALAFEAA